MLAMTSTILAVALAASAIGVPAAAAVNGVEMQQANAQSERLQVDVNTATAEELQKVPGIGEALARRIVEFREEHGSFEKVDDLLNVRGIGVASLEKLRPHLVVKKQG